MHPLRSEGIIQGTECLIIGFLLLCIWWLEAPRRHHLQFIADNSKSILLALTASREPSLLQSIHCHADSLSSPPFHPTSLHEMQTHFLVVIIAAILGDVTHAECVDGLHPVRSPSSAHLYLTPLPHVCQPSSTSDG